MRSISFIHNFQIQSRSATTKKKIFPNHTKHKNILVFALFLLVFVRLCNHNFPSASRHRTQQQVTQVDPPHHRHCSSSRRPAPRPNSSSNLVTTKSTMKDGLTNKPIGNSNGINGTSPCRALPSPIVTMGWIRTKAAAEYAVWIPTVGTRCRSGCGQRTAARGY